MLIINDPEYSRSKFLIPVLKKEWRASSQAQPKDMFGNENQTRFRIQAKSNDGVVIWAGWFDDRDECDAFLNAIALGTLKQEKSLWNLPTPNWQPWMGELLSYEFATVTFLTTPTGSNQTYNRPTDWNNSDNSIECIGAGGSGGCVQGFASYDSGVGGGGGGYSKVPNYASLGATATYQIGTGGATKSASSTTPVAGAVGGDTWFNATTLAGSTCGAKGGGAGAASTSSGTVTGASGGLATGGIGTTKYNGGGSGSATPAFGSNRFTGGGGAAGLNGAGVASAAVSSGSNGVSAGGNGDNGSGGAGSAAVTTDTPTSSNGGAGTEWDATHGSGGGSGAATPTSGNGNATTGTGGLYGAGSGSAYTYSGTTAKTGAGGGGIIVVTYTPLKKYIMNSPMLGM